MYCTLFHRERLHPMIVTDSCHLSLMFLFELSLVRVLVVRFGSTRCRTSDHSCHRDLSIDSSTCLLGFRDHPLHVSIPLASPPVWLGFPTPFQKERLIGPLDASPFQLLPFDWIVLPIGASTSSVLPSTSRHFQGETATKWTRRSAKRSAPGDGFRSNGCRRMSRTGAADRELRGEPQEREEKERPKARTWEARLDNCAWKDAGEDADAWKCVHGA